MIKPSKIPQRKITLPNKGDAYSDKIAQTDLLFGSKRISLLVGPDLLLRFEYSDSKPSKALQNLQKKILRDKSIFSAKKQKLIQSLLVADREIREKLNADKKDLKRRIAGEFKDFTDSLRKRSESLISCSKKLGFDVARNQQEYYCAHCCGFRSGPDLTQTSVPTCVMCKNLLKKMGIQRMDNDMGSYLRGYWFEDYIATVLNQKGWTAWSLPSLMVYGVSGASHQIDVLAVKDGTILIIECKTTEFPPIQVRNFVGKYFDVRCHKASAIAVGRIHPDGMRLIARNPAISSCDNITSYKALMKKISKI